MDVSNSITASAVKARLSDKTSDAPATGSGFGKILSEFRAKTSDTNPISDPVSPNAGVEVRRTIADTSPFDIKGSGRTTIAEPADTSKSGAGRTTIADTSPFNIKSETRTTIARPADISKSDAGRTTVADTSAFDKTEMGSNALERSLSLLLAGQLEAATTHFDGFEALRKSDSR
jgi:hypothetical protein